MMPGFRNVILVCAFNTKINITFTEMVKRLVGVLWFQFFLMCTSQASKRWTLVHRLDYPDGLTHPHLGIQRVRLDPDERETLAQDPMVTCVDLEAAYQPVRLATLDAFPTVDRETFSWALDRIDSRNGLDGIYSHVDYLDPRVTVYVVDTGIYDQHADFGGRASFGIRTSVTIDGKDRNGHGTHVAGLIGSATYGVSRGVSLVSVKAFDDAGFAALSALADAFEWIARDAQGKIAIVNMSFNLSGFPPSLILALRALQAQGIFLVGAGGNLNGLDPCFNINGLYREFTFLGVGAVDNVDPLDGDGEAPLNRRSSLSASGDCLYLFAPGSSITSLANVPGGTRRMSGTSQAAALVSGALGSLLYSSVGCEAGDGSQDRSEVVRRVYQSLIDLGTQNRVWNDRSPANPRLLYIPPEGFSPISCVASDGSPSVSLTPSPSPLVSLTSSPSPLVSLTPSPSPLVSLTPSPSPLVSLTPSPSPLVSSSSPLPPTPLPSLGLYLFGSTVHLRGTIDNRQVFLNYTSYPF